MKRIWLDVWSLLGLAIALTAACDMLQRFEAPALKILYLAWGVACLAAVVLVVVFPKVREQIHAACRDGARFLLVRLILALLILLLGWYVNAAMTNVYGADSPMIADNGYRTFAVLMTLVIHVAYFAFTRRSPDYLTRLDEKRK